MFLRGFHWSGKRAANDDHVLAVHCGSSQPACFATMTRMSSPRSQCDRAAATRLPERYLSVFPVRDLSGSLGRDSAHRSSMRPHAIWDLEISLGLPESKVRGCPRQTKRRIREQVQMVRGLMSTQSTSVLRVKLGVSSWPAALIGIVVIKAVLSIAVKPGSFVVSYSGISYFLLLVLASWLAMQNGIQSTTGGRLFWWLLASGRAASISAPCACRLHRGVHTNQQTEAVRPSP